MTVLCLGEAIVDLVCPEPAASPAEARAFVPSFGGALANVALATGRGGARAALAGGVGDDAWGGWLYERLADEGVDLRWFARVEGLRTPVALVTFDGTGEPSFAVYGEGIEAGVRSLAGRVEEAVDSAEALALGSNTLVGAEERRITLAARERALARGIPVCVDPNLRLHRWPSVEEALQRCREAIEGALCVKCNREEAELLTGEADPGAAAEGIVRLGAAVAVVTLGAGGALARGAAGGEAPAAPTRLVSTLGAGDAFFGALLAALAARDWDPRRAAEALPDAVAAGAGACAQAGAQP